MRDVRRPQGSRSVKDKVNPGWSGVNLLETLRQWHSSLVNLSVYSTLCYFLRTSVTHIIIGEGGIVNSDLKVINPFVLRVSGSTTVVGH